MGRKYSDNALTTLAGAISDVSTTLTVATGKGANFPAITGRGSPGSAVDHFVITMEDSSGNREKIRVEHRAGDVLGSAGFPLVRGYDGTVARSWVVGDSVDLRVERRGIQEELTDRVAGGGMGRLFGVKESTTSGLTLGFYGGQMWVDGVLTTIADGTVGLSASANPNFVEHDRVGAVTANTAGFSVNKFPIAEVVTDAGGITALTDRRVSNELLTGRLSLSVAGGAGNTVLTAAQARNNILEFTGALTGARTIEAPTMPRAWTVFNNTTGAFTLTVKTAAGTGVVVPQGQRAAVYCDGTNVEHADAMPDALAEIIIGAGTREAVNVPMPLGGAQIINGKIAPSVSGGALTLALKNLAGNDPTPESPVFVRMPQGNPFDGTYLTRKATAALSVVVSSGSTLGHSNGIESPVHVYLIDNAGPLELSVSTKFFGSVAVVSTTAEGGIGGADSASTMYSTTARSNVPAACVQRWKSTQTTAGTWASTSGEVFLSPFPLVFPDALGETTSDRQVFNSSGAWNKPTNFPSTSLVLIEAWGGGGGSPGGSSGGGGGGGGSYKRVIKLLSELGVSETVTVGAGGAGSFGVTSGSGGSSSFGSHLTAYGGGGTTFGGSAPGGSGGGIAAVPAAGASNDTSWGEGNGSNPASSPGGNGFFIGGGGPGNVNSGAGGKSVYGGGGGGGSGGATSGAVGGVSQFGGSGGGQAAAGTAPGGGGGAGGAGQTGGAGAAGRVVVTVFV